MSPLEGAFTCTAGPDPMQCATCGGGYSISLFATAGAVDGTVTIEPARDVGLAGFTVWLAPEGGGVGGGTLTDATGHFEFREQTEPARSNNWGVSVIQYTGQTADGAVSKAYRVGIGAEAVQAVTVTSSTLSTVPLTIRNPKCEDPEMRCYKRGTSSGPAPNAPGTAPGRPVNVLTGNVFFDQTDIALPGVSGLSFVRSYNSKNAFRNIASPMSRGWTTSYERSIAPLESKSLTFRDGDGVPLYYEDKTGGGIYQAVLPASETSWIVKAADGTYTRQFRQGGSESFDAAGHLTSIADAVGNTTVLIRDPSGRLIKISDPGGRALTLTYDSAARLSVLSGPDGPIATYTYDDSGFLRTVAYPDGSGYTFTYDTLGQVLRVEDFSGRILESHTYDASGYGLTSELSDGREKLLFAYDRLLQKTTVTDALGNVTTYDWTSVAGLRAVTRISGPCPSCGGAGGDSQEWDYDPNGRVVAYRDGLAHETRYTYSSSGDILTETDPQERVTSYGYDANGRVLTVTKADGGVTTMTQGPAGPLTVTDPIGRRTAISYTGQGKPVTIADPRGKLTTLSYDPAGDLAAVRDPLGHATSFGYDPLGRRTAVTDALNNTTTTSYDARGRATRITSPDETHTDFTYDAGGRRTSVTDPNGRVTRYGYDPYGRLEVVLDPLNGVTGYGYDLMSNLVSLTDARDNVTTFEYDGFQRVKKVTYPGAGAYESFTYDAAGRLFTKTDRKGVTTTYSYDPVGRLKGKTYSDGATPPVGYTYDLGGRLETATNGTDTLTWTYDLAGQLLSEQSAKNASTVAYTYDPGGNRLDLKLDGSLFVTYGYDDASRLTTITRGALVQCPSATSFCFGYDDANRRTSMTYPNGVATSYSYDNLNRLLNLSATKTPTTITNFSYTYDAAGGRTSKVLPDYTESYGYDALSRLTRAERTGSLTGLQSWSYDAVGNRLTNQQDSVVVRNTYNEKNQLLSSAGGGQMLWRGTLDEPGNVTLTSALVNGKPARMLPGNVFEASLPMNSGSNTVTIQATDTSGNVATKSYTVTVTGDGATYSYDPNGNLTQKVEGADTWVYEWTAENELKRVLKNSVEQARFAYDPVGRRVEKVAGGLTTSWTYDDENILREASGATILKYVQGSAIDEHLAVDDGSALSYFHVDGLGSVVKTTSAAGAVTLNRRYDSWGNLELGNTTSGYAFTGREWDPEAGLYYYRARYYDPKIGRFISEDPIRFDGGINFFAYVQDNPVNYVDPYGLRAWLCKVPLPTLGGKGQRSGPDISGNPLYHQYICVERNGVMTCGGQNRSGSALGSPGIPSQDTFDPTKCEPIKTTPCEDQCLQNRLNNPARPWYGIPFGTDCQEFATGTTSGCNVACNGPRTPPTPRPPLMRK